MKYLIVGIGSMGKRRIRNLISLGVSPNDIYVDDINVAKCNLAIKTFGVLSVKKVTSESELTLFICTPPLAHFEALQSAMRFEIGSVFVEAGLNPEIEFNIYEACNSKNIYMYFSTTMNYFPFARALKRMIEDEIIGETVHVQYSSGQNLHDWHPEEKISDYYVTELRSAATREIVCFELTWLSTIFGMPTSPVHAIASETNQVYKGVADSYSLLLMTKKSIPLTLHIDIIAPQALRSIQIQGTKGQISWSSKEGLRLNFESVPLTGKIETEFQSLEYDIPYMLEVSDFLHQKFTKYENTQYLSILAIVESSLPSPIHHTIQGNPSE